MMKQKETAADGKRETCDDRKDGRGKQKETAADGKRGTCDGRKAGPGKQKETAVVWKQDQLAPDIYSLWLSCGAAASIRPGQFVSLYSRDKSRILPRPISLCEISEDRSAIRLVYRIAGAGTREFSTYRKGDTVELLGPLGNGFPLDRAEGKTVLLIGGGIGLPPLLETAKQLPGDAVVIAGYRDRLFLTRELSSCAKFYHATEDGNSGTSGNVLDAIREKQIHGDMIFACGPAPMLRAVKAYAAQENLPCWISMEERMACGVGACLACVCASREVDEHSQVHNKRVCKDGPVFSAQEVEL